MSGEERFIDERDKIARDSSCESSACDIMRDEAISDLFKKKDNGESKSGDSGARGLILNDGDTTIARAAASLVVPLSGFVSEGDRRLGLPTVVLVDDLMRRASSDRPLTILAEGPGATAVGDRVRTSPDVRVVPIEGSRALGTEPSTAYYTTGVSPTSPFAVRAMAAPDGTMRAIIVNNDKGVMARSIFVGDWKEMTDAQLEAAFPDFKKRGFSCVLGTDARGEATVSITAPDLSIYTVDRRTGRLLEVASPAESLSRPIEGIFTDPSIRRELPHAGASERLTKFVTNQLYENIYVHENGMPHSIVSTRSDGRHFTLTIPRTPAGSIDLTSLSRSAEAAGWSVAQNTRFGEGITLTTAYGTFEFNQQGKLVFVGHRRR